MSVRIAVVLSLVIAASSVQTFGQKQQPRQLGQPQVTLPFSPDAQQQGRIGVQRSASPQSPAQQPAGHPIQPEDVRRVLEGWLQEAGSDEAYPADNVYSQRRAAPAVPRRTVMSTDQFALLSSGQQGRQLRLALVSLEEDLNRLQVGAGWKKYLNLSSLLGLLASQQDEPPNQMDRSRLQTIADQFDEIHENPTYRTISQLWGFQMLRNGLRAYAAEPVEHDRQVVRGHAAQLRQSLASVQRGSGWIDYFQLDALFRLVQAKQDLSPAAQKTLQEISERLDEVVKNPEYDKISQMQGFDGTRRALQRLATRRQSLAVARSRNDPNHMERLVRTIQQTLDNLSKSRQEEEKARQALAATETKTSEVDKAHEVLRAIKQRNDEEMENAAAVLETLLVAVKQQRQRDQALQTLSLSSRQGLDIIEKLQAYKMTDDVMGFKVQKKRDGSGAMESKMLTLADRDRAQNVMKRLTLYRQQDCAGRLQLVYPKRDRSDGADGSKELTDRDRVMGMIKKALEEQDSETEYILLQFEDVPEPEQVTLLQFEDVQQPPEYLLLQFEDVPQPEEVILLQFDDVTEEEEEETSEETGKSEE